VPLQASGAWGGAKRRDPVGDAAYGTPRKMLTPSSTLPARTPQDVLAVGRVLMVYASSKTDRSARSVQNCPELIGSNGALGRRPLIADNHKGLQKSARIRPGRGSRDQGCIRIDTIEK
jgi:hypothetical protein